MERLCSWIAAFNIIKMAESPILFYRFSASPIKVPGTFLSEVNSEVHVEVQGNQNSQNNHEKNNVGGSVLLTKLQLPGQ